MVYVKISMHHKNYKKFKELLERELHHYRIGGILALALLGIKAKGGVLVYGRKSNRVIKAL